jgi:hypothetical protein
MVRRDQLAGAVPFQRALRRAAPQPVGKGSRLFRAGVRREGDEFRAAEGVAILIVEALEVIDIDHQCSSGERPSGGRPETPRNLGVETVAVEEAGQRVEFRIRLSSTCAFLKPEPQGEPARREWRRLKGDFETGDPKAVDERLTA